MKRTMGGMGSRARRTVKLQEIVEPCEFQLDPSVTWQTGYQEDGSYLLPGGRKLERAGVGVLLGGFPSEILAHPTLPIAYALIAGRNERHIAVVDLETQTEIQRLSPTGTFTGMALHPNASNLVVAGGGGRAVDRFTIGADGAC